MALEETGKDASVKWASVLDNGAMRREVAADLTVRFKPDAGGERPLVVTAEKQVLLGDVFEVQPAELYARVTVPIVASPSYPWDKYPQVQVMLRYEDAEKGIKTDDTLIVKRDTLATASWSFIALDKTKRSFSYRLLHQAANHEDVDTAGCRAMAIWSIFRDPFGALRLAVDVVPVVPRWEDVEQDLRRSELRRSGEWDRGNRQSGVFTSREGAAEVRDRPEGQGEEAGVVPGDDDPCGRDGDRGAGELYRKSAHPHPAGHERAPDHRGDAAGGFREAEAGAGGGRADLHRCRGWG